MTVRIKRKPLIQRKAKSKRKAAIKIGRSIIRAFKKK